MSKAIGVLILPDQDSSSVIRDLWKAAAHLVTIPVSAKDEPHITMWGEWTEKIQSEEALVQRIAHLASTWTLTAIKYDVIMPSIKPPDTVICLPEQEPQRSMDLILRLRRNARLIAMQNQVVKGHPGFVPYQDPDRWLGFIALARAIPFKDWGTAQLLLNDILTEKIGATDFSATLDKVKIVEFEGPRPLRELATFPLAPTLL